MISRPREVAPLVLAAIPPIILAGFLQRYFVDIPFADQWEFVPMLSAFLDGRLGVSDLWAQHNEHRLLFPRAIMLGLARASGWNIAWESATSFLLACGTMLLVARSIVRAGRRLGRSAASGCWTIALASLLLFSPSQWENWLWGWQLQIFFNVLVAVGGIMLLASCDSSWRRLAGAVACGVLATYSFANGMALWIVGLQIIALAPLRPRERLQRLAVWIVAAAATVWSYFVGYAAVPWHPTPWESLASPLQLAVHVLSYLGGPLGLFHPLLAPLAGAGGLILAARSLYVLRTGDVETRHAALPFLGLWLYALGCAVVTGFGRSTMGADQALASKYITLSNLFWIGTVCLVWTEGLVRSGAVPSDGRSRSRGVAVLLATVAVLVLLTAGVGTGQAQRRHQLLQPCPELLRQYDLARPVRLRAALGSIHPSPQLLEHDVRTLQRHRLSVFRTATAARRGTAPVH